MKAGNRTMMHKEDRLYKLSKGSDTAMWAHDEIVNQDNRIEVLERELHKAKTKVKNQKVELTNLIAVLKESK
tara:strand:- start:440 stop:655 length:216 start_codon:yes stop_codon:yes gene_type:complete